MASDRGNALKAQVLAGALSEAALIAAYRNAERLGEKELQELIAQRVRADFPRAANRLFGVQVPEAVSRLESVYKSVSAKFDLSSNKLGNGVKAGGSKRSGAKYISYYLSYKNASNEAAALTLSQDTGQSELVATVSHYKTGRGAFKDLRTFGMHDFEQAVGLYEQHLQGLMS